MPVARALGAISWVLTRFAASLLLYQSCTSAGDVKVRAAMNDRTATRSGGTSLEAAFNKAGLLRKQGDMPGAEQLYRDILKQRPSHFGTLCRLAELLTATSRCEEAARL